MSVLRRRPYHFIMLKSSKCRFDICKSFTYMYTVLLSSSKILCHSFQMNAYAYCILSNEFISDYLFHWVEQVKISKFSKTAQLFFFNRGQNFLHSDKALGLYQFFYCWITNYHQLNGSKQHTFIMSIPVGQKYRYNMAELSAQSLTRLKSRYQPVLTSYLEIEVLSQVH